MEPIWSAAHGLHDSADRMDLDEEDVLYDDDQEESSNESVSGEDSDFDIEEPCTPKRPHMSDDFHYECLTPEALVTYMNEIIDDVNNVFQVSAELAERASYSLSSTSNCRTFLPAEC